MAATVTIPVPQEAFQAIGSLSAVIFDVTLATNDYVTNGIDFSSILPGGKTLIGAAVLSSTGTGSLTQIPAVDKTNKKLVLLKGTAGVNAEVSNGSSDAQVVRLLAFLA
jgi:hypothetical protein